MVNKLNMQFQHSFKPQQKFSIQQQTVVKDKKCEKLPVRQKSQMIPTDVKSGYILRATGPSSKERNSKMNSSMTTH